MKDIYKTEYKTEKYYLRNNTTKCLRECKRKVPYKVKLTVHEIAEELLDYFKKKSPNKVLAYVYNLDYIVDNNIKNEILISTKYSAKIKDYIDLLNKPAIAPANGHKLALITEYDVNTLYNAGHGCSGGTSGENCDKLYKYGIPSFAKPCVPVTVDDLSFDICQDSD